MSGSRWFFVACLLVSGLALLLILPGLMPAQAMPPAAAAGLGVWRAAGCENCHTLYGQGGPFAPDLTHTYAQRGPDYLAAFLVNPSAFYPGQRQMPVFGFTRSEIDQLIAYLDWIGQQPPAQTWPPRPILVSGSGGLGSLAPSPVEVSAASDDPAVRGRALFSQPPAICSTCHSLEPDVVIIGPSLAGVASRAETRVAGQTAEAYLRSSIIHPEAFIVPGFQDVMQKNFGSVLSADQINDLIAFLLTLR